MTDGPPTVLRVVIPGQPIPKGRARGIAGVSSKTGKPFARMVTPGETRSYEDKVRTLTQIAVNQARWTWSSKDDFEVIVRIFRPWRLKGGDADNILKSVLDGMNRVAFPDDSYVSGFGVKRFKDVKNPRVEVELRRVPAKW